MFPAFSLCRRTSVGIRAWVRSRVDKRQINVLDRAPWIPKQTEVKASMVLTVFDPFRNVKDDNLPIDCEARAAQDTAE